MLKLTPFSLDTPGTKIREDAILISREPEGFKVLVCITNSDELQIASELRKYENRHQAGFNYETYKSATVVEYQVTSIRTDLLRVFNSQIKLKAQYNLDQLFEIANTLDGQPKNLQTAYATLLQTANLLCAEYMYQKNRPMLYRNCTDYDKAYLSLKPLPNIAFDNQIYGRFTSPLRRLEDLINLKCLVCAFEDNPAPYSEDDMQNLAEKKRIQPSDQNLQVVRL